MTTTVAIHGMHCRACETLIRDVTLQFPAIMQLDVDIRSKRVTIHHDAKWDYGSWKKEVENISPRYRVQSVG